MRRAAVRAGVTKEACCRTLRRSYTVQCLRDSMNVAELSVDLGHKHVESTLAYSRYVPAKDAGSLGAGAPALCLPPLESCSFSPALAAIQSSAP